jgi:hypothetical protein
MNAAMIHIPASHSAFRRMYLRIRAYLRMENMSE